MEADLNADWYCWPAALTLTGWLAQGTDRRASAERTCSSKQAACMPRTWLLRRLADANSIRSGAGMAVAIPSRSAGGRWESGLAGHGALPAQRGGPRQQLVTLSTLRDLNFLLQEGIGKVDRLVTLGSPHNPPPPGVVDQTRGILSHVAATCPGNFHEQVG